MSRDNVYLLDILQAARLAVQYLHQATLEAFLDDVRLQDSVIRRLEIVGEAARRVSEPARLTHSHLPWREMIGMRNIVIHEYDNVDLTIVWDAVKKDLPPLIEALEQIVPPETS